MLRMIWLDVRAGLRERKLWLAVGVFAYAVAAMPLLLARPPAHVMAAMDAFFGARDPFTLFMYVWTDLAMNKLAAFVGVVLGGGILLRERDTRVLPVLAAKPITLPRYFAVRAVSACLTMAGVYLAAQVVATPYFMVMVAGFRPGEFLAAGLLHVWAAVFATALAATLVVVVGRRGPGLLLALVVLSVLVGLAFIGFYNPAWRAVAAVNPFALAVEAVGHPGALGPGVLLPPMLALVVMTAATIAAGARSVRGMEA